MIYHVSRNRGEGLGFSRFKDNPLFSKPSNVDKTKPKAVFVKSQSEVQNESASDRTSKPEAPKSKALKGKTSEPKTFKPQAKVKSKEVVGYALKSQDWKSEYCRFCEKIYFLRISDLNCVCF